jgi:hypothetical protein
LGSSGFHDFLNAMNTMNTMNTWHILFSGCSGHMLSRREVSLSIFEEIYGQVTIEQPSSRGANWT